MQKKINAYYDNLNEIQNKIYPETMNYINFENCENWDCDDIKIINSYNINSATAEIKNK